MINDITLISIIVFISPELKGFFIKIIVPALIAVSIKIAVQHKRETISVISVVCSMVSGLGSAYLFAGLVMSNFSEEWVPLVIGVITISGERIGEWITFKFNVESLLEGILTRLTTKKK